MKIFISILLAVITVFSSYGTTREELGSRLEKANKLRQHDSRAAMTPLYDIFIEAAAQGWDTESARSLTSIGWALYNLRYPDLAIQVLTHAQSYCDADDTETRDIISMGLGACHSATGEYGNGEQMLLNSLEQSRRDGRDREQMMIYTYLGDLYTNIAKESKAKEYFEKGRELAHKINDTIFESALYCNIGTLCPDIHEAENQLFKSIDLSRQINNIKTESYAYINLAELYYNNREYAKAMRTAEQINRFLPSLENNDKVIAYYHTLLSSIYAAQGDYPAAYNQMALASKQTQADNIQTSKERAEYNTMVINIMRLSETNRLEHQKQAQDNAFTVMWTIIAAIMLIALIFFFLYRKTRAQHKQLVIKRNEISNLEANATKHESEISDTRHTMNYLFGFYRGRNTLLERISQLVKDGYKMNGSQLTTHLRMINNTISQSLTNDKEPEWVKRLEEDTDSFVKRLTERYPDMSKTDIMLASFYRLGLSTRDIARITGKLPTTITTARYRMRTSMNIPEDTDLNEFFQAI